MSSAWCKTCGQLMLWPDTHRCPPVWRVWETWWGTDPDDGPENAAQVYATDAQSAAERYREADSCDFEAGDVIDVAVRSEDGELTEWTVVREAVPEYSASPMPPRKVTS